MSSNPRICANISVSHNLFGRGIQVILGLEQFGDHVSTVVNLAHLESHLWEAANILRGSPVDRTDWKSYILPALFFKRICDVWARRKARMPPMD
jgi:hypothetical protein